MCIWGVCRRHINTVVLVLLATAVSWSRREGAGRNRVSLSPLPVLLLGGKPPSVCEDVLLVFGPNTTRSTRRLMASAPSSHPPVLKTCESLPEGAAQLQPQ